MFSGTSGTTRISQDHSPEEAAKTRQQVPRDRRLHSRFAYRNKKKLVCWTPPCTTPLNPMTSISLCRELRYHVRLEYEYCDVCVNRSDDNVLHDCFQVSQRLTSDPKTTPQQCLKEIDNAANRADHRSARHVRSWLQEWKIPALDRRKEKDTQHR